jgi:hypothetical protein
MVSMSLLSDSRRLSDSSIPSSPPSSGSVGSEGERSEPERATEPDDGGATPDPEVVQRPVRRHFTATYKQPSALGRSVPVVLSKSEPWLEQD